jgi:hypothetical protein
MSMTKITTIVWGSEGDQIHPTLHEARAIQLAEMINDEKTDGRWESVDDVTTNRYWRDLAAAEEFISFITEQSAIHNCNIISTSITDAPPE